MSQRDKTAIAVKERMEELARERGTTLRDVLREMRANPRPSELVHTTLPTPDVVIIERYCARLGVSLGEFFEDERFR